MVSQSLHDLSSENSESELASETGTETGMEIPVELVLEVAAKNLPDCSAEIGSASDFDPLTLSEAVPDEKSEGNPAPPLHIRTPPRHKKDATAGLPTAFLLNISMHIIFGIISEETHPVIE